MAKKESSRQDSDVLTTSEVAKRFRVEPRTVSRWAQRGLVPFFSTPTGHRRYPRADIESMAALEGLDLNNDD